MTSDPAPHRSTATGIRLVLAAVVLGMALPAEAASDLDTEMPPVSDPDAAAPSRADSNHVTLGAGVAAVAQYQGSDEYRARPVPLVDVKMGRFFARTGEGIGVNIVETPTFTAGAGVNWMPGYDGDDVPEGIRELDSALGARVFVSGRFRGVVATLAATQAITEKDRGLIVNAGAAYPIRATDRLTITPSVATTWANGKYMNSYFGVDSFEAAASGLPRYQPSSGFKDVSFRVSLNYRVTDSINAVGSVGVMHLLDKAAESPFVEKKTQPIALVGLNYTF